MSALLTQVVKNNDVENLGLDIRSIQSGKGDKKAQFKRLAVQFEEMLINTLLKEAFKEHKDDDDEGGMPLMAGSGTYKDLRTMYLSQYFADNGGLGYSKIIEEQLTQKYNELQGGDGEKSEKKEQEPFSLDTVKTVPARIYPAGKKLQESPTPPDDAPLKVSDPVSGPVSSNYGWRKDPIDGRSRFHAGIDFEVPPHTPVKSFMEGTVTFSGWQKGYGYLVEVQHPNGMTTRYGHNAELTVKEGDHVESGATIALSGSSGRSTGPHLHFEVRKGDFSLDPRRFLQKEYLARK